jgi:hypothetical protein
MPSLNYFDKDKQEWVAIPLGGGTVDTAGLATEQFVTDAIAAIPESAITAHAGAVPDAGADTPRGLETAFSVLDDGLHYYKDVGTLVSITRQEYQTTIVLSGLLNSYAKIVKSEAGLPTPQNPSMIVMQRAEGQWLKLTSDELDKPFGNSQQVDIFSLTGGTTDLSGYYTKPEVDGVVAGKADQSELAAFQGQYGTLESEFREYFRLLNQGFATVAQKPDVDAALDLKADKANTYTKTEVDVELDTYFQQADSNLQLVAKVLGDSIALKADKTTVSGLSTTLMNSIMEVKDGTYTKPEVDEAIAGAVSGQLTPEQITEIISQVGPVDLTAYAKISDNTQNLLAKVVTAQGYGFGDKNEPPAALTYTDTGAGYGERLVLATVSSIEYVVMKSDFDPLKSRMDALESKAAPTIDAYTKAECDAKFLTLVDIDRFAYQADVYTQKQVDDRFMRIDQAFSKVDFDNQMALMLYSRKQVDDKLAAISPVGANSINDPALAGFKTSILDAVKLMLVGGTKMPPADIDWTWMVRMDGAKESVSTEIQARMIGGFIELKGTLSFGAGSGAWVPLRLPPQFPMAELEASYPLAMRLVGTAVTYGYCTVSNKNRDISCSPGAKSSEANFSGIRWKAAY